jgi:phage-related protein
MSDSVGKISLDLELKSDLGKQIQDASNKIGKELKGSLQGLETIDFSKFSENLTASFKASMDKAFGGMDAMLETTMKTIQARIDATIEATKQNMLKAVAEVNAAATKSLEGFKALAKTIKMPRFNFPKSPNQQTPNISPAVAPIQPRAPSIPNIGLGINTEQIKAQIESLTATLDNINNRIEQQKDKLKLLKEQYASTFNPATKNKLQEQILKTEAAINKLVASSDKAGFKLADLDAKLAGAGSAAGVLGNASNKAGNQANKASNSFKIFGNSVKNTGNNMRGSHNQFNMMMRSIVTWGLIFPAIIKGITATGRFLGQAVMTNQQFANSLVQIKSNLYTAFMPIYQAVLPAINTLMSALSTATAYIASFMNTLFGKTFQQGMQSAKGLVAAKVAMGAYGEAAKKAGKDAKGALAGFDELNILNTSNEDEDGAGTGGSKVPEIVAPNLDTSALDKSTNIWAQRFKQVLGTIFTPFKNAWAKDGAGVMAEFRNAVDGTKGTLNSFFNMLATPPVQLFLENVGRLILAIIKLGLRIYDSFILPIVNWFISILPGAAQGLNPIIEIVTRLVNYLAGDGFIYVQIFLAAVLGLVAGIKTFNILTAVVTWFKGLGTMITVTVIPALKLLWVTMTANPIVLVISIIAALVVAFMTLWATNENFRNAMKAIWENIKNIFSSVLNWLKDSFTRDWSVIFGIFGDPINAFFVNLKNKIDAVKQIFRGLIDFISGIFTGDWDRAWRGVLNVFGGIFNGITAMVKSPLNTMIGLLNGAITGFNTIKFPDWVPGVGGMGINISKIPYLAKGGIIDSPTLAMVGEAGKEAVMPLENNTGWIDLLADKLTQRLGGINTGGTSNSSTDRAVEIVIQLGGYEFARFIIDSINKLQRQTGTTLLKI